MQQSLGLPAWAAGSTDEASSSELTKMGRALGSWLGPPTEVAISFL